MKRMSIKMVLFNKIVTQLASKSTQGRKEERGEMKDER